MTFHSKAAINDVYDLFNQPLKCEAPKDDTQSGGESDLEDDGYSTAGESTGTGMVSGAVSDSGNEDTSVSVRLTMIGEESTSTGIVDEGGEWTEFSTSRHVPCQRSKDHQDSNDPTYSRPLDNTSSSMVELQERQSDELKTPVESHVEMEETKTNTRFVPIPPENYDPTPLRTFRDPANVAQSRLPFMTPIVEKTESSLAPNTGYQKVERDYFSSQTPSRASSTKDESPSKTPLQTSSTRIETPSKLGVDSLLLSSPLAKDSSHYRNGGKVRSATELEFPVSPSPKSKRASRSILEEEDDLTSPRKRVQITQVEDSPTRIKVSVTTNPTSRITADYENGFTKPAPPTPHAASSNSRKPIITDLQCNPTDSSIRNQILANIQPPLSSYPGFFNRPDQKCGRYTQLQKYARKVQDSKVKSSPRKLNDKTITQAVSPILSFTGASRVYAVKRELGQGAFAPVYLVESYDPDCPIDDDDDDDATDPHNAAAVKAEAASINSERAPLEAIKAESPPSQALWEFHIIRTIHQRLYLQRSSSSSSTPTSQHSSALLSSIITAHECHAFSDEAYLILDYAPTGTLLDLVNLIKADNTRAGKPGADSSGLDEPLAMFFAVELLRTMESLHRVGILHGDIKGDNCLIRFPRPRPSSSSSTAYLADSLPLYSPSSLPPSISNPWSSIGLRLIDFGRGIDLYPFSPSVSFIADWAAGPTDAPEIREARPWRWQIDLWGAAGVAHLLLFGKYLDTVPIANPAGSVGVVGNQQKKKKYKLKDGFKRYWQAGIWAQVFDACLNPHLPVTTDTEELEREGGLLSELERVRAEMERF